MIVIVSDADDHSTTQVCDWLNALNKKFIIIHRDDEIRLLSIDSEGTLLIKVDDKVISSNDVTSFWYRRGALNIKFDVLENVDIPMYSSIQNFLRGERHFLTEFVHSKLGQKKRIGSYYNADVNKLKILQAAEEAGLNVPSTIVTTEKHVLASFVSLHLRVITKAISASLFFAENGVVCNGYTEIISNENLSGLPETFPPSLFQNLIPKKYELRIFYLAGKFFSMAIFSQLDEQTRVDFRKYNNRRPNRTVPFKLPTLIECQLEDLMQKCSLNSGSIDVIVDDADQYHFLEVNPVGQFGMVSRPCNYYLEKEIAEHL